jgi:hypothetical protein
MRGRKLRSGSLLALLGALILVLGAAPTFGQETGNRERDVFDRKPDKGTRDYPHKANRVTIWFTEALVTDNPDQKTTISVEDECGRRLSSGVTEAKNTRGNEDFVGKAWVMLDRRNTNPKGLYYVTAEYWLESDEEENSEDPEGEDPPAAQARTYTYKFKVHGGPNCDGSSGGGGNHPPGHGGGGSSGDKKRVWGTTSGSGHDPTGGHAGHENLRSATGSTTTDHTPDHTTSDFTPYTSPTIPSSHDDPMTHTGSTTPFGEDDFGDPFGESTGNSPLSDPTDPTLYDSEVGQVPEEAEDQTLSAAPADELEPEASTLVVALATALLLGVGGGLFLRRTDPAPIRPRS